MNATPSRSRLARGFVLAGLLLLPGCANSRRVADRPHQSADHLVESQLPPLMGEFSTTPPPPMVEPTTTATAPGDRPAALIGLYGELLSDSVDAGGPFDGSSNVSQVTFAAEGACFDPDINRDATLMTFASTQHRTTSDIYLKSIPGRTITQLTTDPADDLMPAFHPTGNTIAFASNRAGNWDIYVMSVDGGQPMKVTDEPEHELHPSWSPDGRQLIYCKLGSQSGRWEMWVVDIDNPGVRRFLDYGLFPQWCPDVARSKILFQRARQRGSRYHSVWTVDYINGDAMHPTEIISAANAAIINPSWAPDGQHIVFVTAVEPNADSGTAPQQTDVWIVDLDGSRRANLTNGRYANFQPVWSSDGRVFFVSNRSGNDNVWSVTTARAMVAVKPQPQRITSGAADSEQPGWQP